jgi:succinyl-diaminopimelate desuccinylase
MFNTNQLLEKSMDALSIARNLIQRQSVTPEDAGCQLFVAELLAARGFRNEHVRIGATDNLWSVHGEGEPLFCCLGHTDVVPAGPESDWQHPPFSADEENGFLYGRGAADMKGCLASFVSSALEFVQAHPDHKGSLAFLLTSDEEGAGVDGTVAMIEKLQARRVKIDYCLVCEPSSEEELGDVIKIGRRGSLSGTLQVFGIQGHVAYPHLALNPIHRCLPALAELVSQQWDEGDEHFPATTFQISNIISGTGADNIIPGKLDLVFNFRYGSALSPETIKNAVHEILDRHKLDYRLNWKLSGLPFLTGSGKLLEAICSAVEEDTQKKPRLSTAGGTSDGRHVAPTGAEVAELGLINATIHKVNENVSIEHLARLSKIYRSILDKLLL